MSGTIKSDSALMAELPDNTSGLIVPVDIRDTVASKLSISPTTVAAAGTTQGTATAMTNMYNIVTSGTGGVVVQASNYTRVWNALAVAINVYPPSGAQFYGFGTNLPVIVGVGESVDVMMTSSTQGYVITEGASPAINAQTGTTYTLLPSDNGQIVNFNNGSAITVTLPNSLWVGFQCALAQTGAGQVTLSAASGASFNNRLGFTKLAGQYATGNLLVDTNAGGTSAHYVFVGDGA